MKKFIPYEKLSKKARRALDLQQRGSWEGIRHATVPAEADKRAYKRHPKHKGQLPDE
ncbi:MAG: hypothetical protein IKI21_09610 [Oscillospiraceae bacterium]|nr:hypothetical protein [Oscillospiraceae bacterium]